MRPWRLSVFSRRKLLR